MEQYINIDELINKAANAAADNAIKKYKDKENQEKKKKAFHNTELLLKKYDILMEHCKNAKYYVNDVLDEVLSECELINMDEDEIYIKSILRSKTRTQIMLNQIDTSILLLKKEMEKKDQIEKFRAMEMIFFQDPEKQKMDFEDIAEQLHCNKDTVRRWRNEMVKELSIYLFGVDGLRIDL